MQVQLRWINDTTVAVTYVTNSPNIGPFDTTQPTSNWTSYVGVVATIIRVSTKANASTADDAKTYYGCGCHAGSCRLCTFASQSVRNLSSGNS